MKNDSKQEVDMEEKVQTRYDKKIEARRIQEAKDKRNARIAKIVALIVCIGIVAAIGFSVVVSVLNKKEATKDTYVKVGNYELTKMEYDFYYQSSVNTYLTTYSSMLPYMGLDVNSDFATQPYSDTMSWKDLFDQETVNQIKRTKALTDDAAANQFTHDPAQEYQTFLDNMKAAADTAGITVAEYYKNTYGAYATQKSIEPYVKEQISASAYYQDLLTKNAPTQEEVKEYYEQNKISYDKVDYRSFAFTTGLAEDASEEEVSKAMQEIKTKADAMMKEREGGADFESLCVANASEETKASYEDEATEFSLTEGAYSYGVPSVATTWLYEEGRAEGDITVIEDEAGKQVYVIEFIKKYFDEADNETISGTIASTRVSEYMNTLAEKYEVTDVKGDLKYLTIEAAPTEAGAEETTDTTDTTAEEAPAETPEETAAPADAEEAAPAETETAAPADTAAEETPAE